MRSKLISEFKAKVELTSLTDLKNHIAQLFFRMDITVESVYMGLLTGKNVILYGPGGFGKSQIVKAIIDFIELPSSTVVGYKDMDPEALIGIPDMKKLLDESIYQVAFENSVFRNPGVLILEEFLDAKPSTAAALKDILTEGGLRRGDVFVESYISSVIVCTNKNPRDLSTDDSLRAFYQERFPIAVEVTWESFLFTDYYEFLQHKGTDLSPQYIHVLSELCSRTVKSTSNIISPRLVLDAVDIILMSPYGIRALSILPVIDTSALAEVIYDAKLSNEKRLLEGVVGRVTTEVSNIMHETKDSVNSALKNVSKLKYMKTKLIEMGNTYSTNFDVLADTITIVDNSIATLTQKLTVSTTVSDIVKLDRIFEL